ncbi:MAG: type II toxin-antitoxin system HipA family toxin [Planctomycetia bacterium]
MNRVLTVWWSSRIVGELTQNEHGELGFAYAPAWLDDMHTLPLSASLPKRVEAFTRRECRPFFGGLLPEEGQREIVAQALGVSAANDFSLLDHLGGEVAGAIELLPPGVQPIPPPTRPSPIRLDDAALIKVLDDLPLRPFLVGERGLRLSLAGSQSKIPVVLVDHAVALPAPGQPTTHILKPPIERFTGTTENETFVMRLARAVGLDVAAVEPRAVHGRKFLLVERYDRVIGPDGRVERIHQEDFCQSLGVPPERKYAGEGGPTFRECFGVLRSISTVPGVDVMKLLDAAIFNVIVGNADAHGKNFSILYQDGGPRLAPLYDLLSTAMYPELSARFAMKIGTRSTLGELDARGWETFASNAGIGRPLVRRRVMEMAAKVKAHVTSVATSITALGAEPAVVDRLATLIGGRIGPCVASLTR